MAGTEATGNNRRYAIGEGRKWDRVRMGDRRGRVDWADGDKEIRMARLMRRRYSHCSRDARDSRRAGVRSRGIIARKKGTRNGVSSIPSHTLVESSARVLPTKIEWPTTYPRLAYDKQKPSLGQG